MAKDKIIAITNLISLRNHLLTHDERQFIAGSTRSSPVAQLILMSVAGMIAVLGLAGGWYLFAEEKWLFPWDVAARHPWLTIACLPFVLRMAYKRGYKPLRTAQMKYNKLIANTATQADIDTWTKEVTGQIYRNAQGGAPQIMNDITLESTMADAKFKPPR